VADAVASCSDSAVSDPKKKLQWHKRKKKYLVHLRSASKDALLVATADKLHNARAILSDYRELGKQREQLWERFNAPKKDQLWYYGELVETLQRAGAPKVLVDELSRVVAKLKQATK